MGQNASYFQGVNTAFYKPVTNTVFKDTWETRGLSKEEEIGTEDLIQFLIALQDRVATSGVYLGLGQVRGIVDKIQDYDHGDYYHLYKAIVTVEEDDHLLSPKQSPRRNTEGYIPPKTNMKNTSGKLTIKECQAKSNELLKLISKVDLNDPESVAPPSPRSPRGSHYSQSDPVSRGSSNHGRSPRSSMTLPADGRVSPSTSSSHLSLPPTGSIRTSPNNSPKPNRAGGSPRPSGSMVPRINSAGFATVERQPYVRQHSNPKEPISPGLDVSPDSPKSPRARPSTRNMGLNSPSSPKIVPSLNISPTGGNGIPILNFSQPGLNDPFKTVPMFPMAQSVPDGRNHNAYMSSPRVQEPDAVYKREELKQLTQQMYNIVNQVYMDSQLFCKEIPSSQYSVISSQCLINLSKVSKAAALIQKIDSKGVCQDIQDMLPLEIGNVMDIYRGIASSGDKTIVFSSNLFQLISFIGKLLASLNWDGSAVFTKLPMM